MSVSGTDSAASAARLDVLAEARLAWMMQRALHPECQLPAEKAIYMLTAGAAKIIGMSETLGTLEPGKLADMAIFNVDAAGDFFVKRPFDALLYGPVSVQAVFIGGQNVELSTYNQVCP